MYIWEQPDWPKLSWKDGSIAAPLATVRHDQGRLIGRMQALGFKLREEAVLQTLTQDVVKTSEIEGEQLDATQVRSSLARRLGIDIGALPPTDRNVEGIVEVMLDATRNFQAPLTAERLFGWHAALFPTGRSGMTKIIVGDWRDDSTGPMQVVSGPYGREKVHYSAPPAPPFFSLTAVSLRSTPPLGRAKARAAVAASGALSGTLPEPPVEFPVAVLLLFPKIVRRPIEAGVL